FDAGGVCYRASHIAGQLAVRRDRQRGRDRGRNGCRLSDPPNKANPASTHCPQSRAVRTTGAIVAGKIAGRLGRLPVRSRITRKARLIASWLRVKEYFEEMRAGQVPGILDSLNQVNATVPSKLN